MVLLKGPDLKSFLTDVPVVSLTGTLIKLAALNFTKIAFGLSYFKFFLKIYVGGLKSMLCQSFFHVHCPTPPASHGSLERASDGDAC